MMRRPISYQTNRWQQVEIVDIFSNINTTLHWDSSILCDINLTIYFCIIRDFCLGRRSSVERMTALHLSLAQPSGNHVTYLQLVTWCTRGDASPAERWLGTRGRRSPLAACTAAKQSTLRGWQREDNSLWKHKEKCHPQERCEFSLKAEKFFKDACTRAIF